MRQADVVVVGGSAAGIESAVTATRYYPDKKIVVIRKEKQALVPCGIPYIMSTLGSVEKDVMPAGLLGDVELLVDEVVTIDRGDKCVHTTSGEIVAYDKLILATGSRPIAPLIPGSEFENVFLIRKDIDYLAKLQRALNESRNIVIVGGGFIGAEFADECQKLELHVTIVEMLSHCLYLNCDTEFCIDIEKKLRASGVDVATESRVTAIEGQGRVEAVRLMDGRRIPADVVILATGVSPNYELALDASLDVGETKGILVDQYQTTNDSNIFAVGDCAEKYCYFTGQPIETRLASVATREGRIAAANLFHPRRKRNRGTIGVYATVVAGTAVAVAGMTQRGAEERGFEIVVGAAKAADRHPGTMPGASELRVKLIFDRFSHRLVGGEAYGGITAGEIANVMAYAISFGATARDLAISHVGTHPALTASPLVYQIVCAAEEAVLEMEREVKHEGEYHEGSFRIPRVTCG